MVINIPTCEGFFAWRPACWARVTGTDAATFLQGQFTNDLRTLANMGAVYGLWLTLKGKVQADGFVLRGKSADEFWIGSYFSPAAVICGRLEGHVIADDVTITDETAEWCGVSVLGSSAGKGLPVPAGPNAWAFAGRRTQPANLEFVYRMGHTVPSWMTSEGTAWLTEEAVNRCRIGAGIPAIPFDVGIEDLPNEAGLESDAISYTKGCYLGQEVMARLKSMGQLRRRLWRVHGAGETIPSLPAPVFAEARRVGDLRSAVRDGSGGWIGLAMLSLLHVSAGAELSFCPGGPTTLRVNDIP